MTIKHLLLSGGGINGMIFTGILKKLIDEKYIELDKIETIYGASVGGLLGLILCLKIDYDDIIKYLIERPWHKAFQKIDLNTETFFNVFSEKGILDDKIIKIMMSNLFKCVDINENITFKELYEYSKINLIISSVCINTFDLTEFSHEKTPLMKVIDAVYCSASIPFIFKPKYINNSFHMDSGLIKNYPVKNMLNYCKNEEIFGLSLLTPEEDIQINQDDDVFKYFYKLMNKLMIRFTRDNELILKNEIQITVGNSIGDDKLWDFFCKKEERQKKFDMGIKKGDFYLRTLNNSI